MATLTRKISSRENHLPISGALARDGGFIAQIGEEFVAVQAGGLGATLVVERGFLGSFREAHAAGAAVTPVQLVVQTDAPTAPPAATTGGVPLSTRAVDLGVVNFDDFDGDRYFTFGTFEAGTIVLRIFAVPVIEWDFDLGEPLRYLSFGTAVGGDPLNNGQTLTSYPDPETNPFFAGTYAESPLLDSARDPGQQGQAVAGVVNAAGVYFASFYNGGTPLTAGQSHVYAVIATPS
jgi:hypothetical protein